MSNPKTLDVPLIGHVVHPTDFSPDGEAAFLHAIKTALTANAKLTILHVASKKNEADWSDFPGVRAALERWGLLPMNSSRADVSKLGIDVQKILMVDKDPVRAVTAYLAGHPADIIVLATNPVDGRAQWLRQSVAEPLARKSHLMTLFVPKGTSGFVSDHDGSITLKNILIPVASIPDAQPAIQAAARLVYRLNCSEGLFTVLHVGEADRMPALRYPEVPGWRWSKITNSGDVIGVILEEALNAEADLIMMSTDGRHGFLDALRGSHSERILRGSPCPLLAIPAGGFLAKVLQVEST
ncbi:MAG TPA: universal stress protein [Nitrospiraceae bacterium]|nr:universal stress protein [Nitrospiraceae bacterium]